MTIINIFNERLKREMPELQVLSAAYADAVSNAEDWAAEAEDRWNEMIDKVANLIAQAMHEDLSAMDKLQAWIHESGGTISLHTDKIKRQLPRVIAEAVVTGFTTLGEGLVRANEDEAEPEKPTDGPKAV